MNNQELITEALSQAGQPTTVTPEQNTLEQLRITPEKQLNPMDFLFRLFGKPCFPRGELVAVTGKAKSGKTFLTSMLMACSATSDVLSFHREREEPLRVLWYDTEQSDESTQDILKHRLLPMTDGDVSRIDVFNVRCLSWKKRRELLGVAVDNCSPDLVIVDGIRDLVNDINDGILAQEVTEELMHLATKYNSCITCVLHQNKSGEDRNLRGWIGTELMNKAFEVYACEKLLPQRIFSVEQTLTRKYDIEQGLYFEVNEQGLPVSTVNIPVQGQSKNSENDSYPQLNTDYIRHDDNGSWQMDVRRLFSDAIGGRQQMTGGDLRTQVCQLCNIRSWKFYNSLLEQAINDSVLMKSYDHAGHVIYALKPQAPVQTELYQDVPPF